MRFPEWARNDHKLRLKYLCAVMSAYAHRDCSILKLSVQANVNYHTAMKSMENGRMSYRVATAMAEAAAGSGVKAVWLIAPDMISLNADGEIVE